MKLLGYEISISKAATPQPTQPLWQHTGNWWWPVIREPFTGAWQRNMELRVENILSFFAVYACISLISTDIGKLRIRLMRQDNNRLWQETSSPAFSPVLLKPNHFQTRNKFIEQWILSKLIHGNTYVLKARDNRGVVVRMYILDPLRIKPLVAPDGSVFYELPADNLSGVEEALRVPASEICHDVMVPLFHPLCGVSPLFAAALPALQGLKIQQSSTQFFTKGSRPGGILTSPHVIDNITAVRLKDEWEQNFSGDNAGKVAVLGDGLKFEAMGIPAEEAQLIEQLKWTAENVCSVFHVPPYMIGIGAPPTLSNNVEALTQVYYSQCLQHFLEAIENLLDDGLGLTQSDYHAEFNLQDLLKMDTATLTETTANGVKAGILSPNEARAKFNLPPTRGGESPLLQQQNYSLAALADRDKREAAQVEQQPQPADDDDDDDDQQERTIDVDRLFAIEKSFG